MRKPNQSICILIGLKENRANALDKFWKQNVKPWYLKEMSLSDERYQEAHNFLSHWNKLVDRHYQLFKRQEKQLRYDYEKTYNL